MVKEWAIQRSGWEHGGGCKDWQTVLLPGFLKIYFSFSCFSWGLLTLEQLFALVLYFRYPRVYQTLLEYTAVCYHLVYTAINSIWGFLSHLSYLIPIHWQVLLVYIEHLKIGGFSLAKGVVNISSLFVLSLYHTLSVVIHFFFFFWSPISYHT